MKKLLLAVVALALVVGTMNVASAGNIWLSVGGDVLIPMGTFSDNQGVGFGGSARGQYNFTPMASAGLTIGYYTWTGKDHTVLGQTVTGTKFSGLPIRVFGKYYFMPEGEKMRAYGIAELGLFFWSVDVPSQTIQTPIGPITTGGGSTTGSDFNYAPGVGIEFPVGSSGKTMIDVSVRYDGIATSGGSSGSLGARVGVNFGLGN